jgi:hypothetical protein
MSGRAQASKPGGFGVFEGFSCAMTPKLVPSDFSGSNLIDIDHSHHLSPKTDRVCHAHPRPSVKT